MAKKSLLEPAYEPVDLLLGITATLRDYRLAHFLNKTLGIDLKSIDDLPVYVEKLQHNALFPLFWHHHKHLRSDFFLVANSNGEILMLPALKNFTYFLIVKGDAPDKHFDEIPKLLREIPGIQAAFPIAPESVKNIPFILADLELHMIEVQKKMADNQEGQ
ncbi:MAG TPA: IPExxxVDY family protein [Bacteroidales bacterium]|nr:IPExxxVDY family protein [Bacteroidales bacterium]